MPSSSGGYCSSLKLLFNGVKTVSGGGLVAYVYACLLDFSQSQSYSGSWLGPSGEDWNKESR